MTADARAVLPREVARGDAVANLARTGLLVLALTTGDYDLLGEAMTDRLHQPYRAALFPHVNPLIAAARQAGAFGACLSGAGPSVLALEPGQRVAAVRAAMATVAAGRAVPGEAIALEIARDGVAVSADAEIASRR